MLDLLRLRLLLALLLRLRLLLRLLLRLRLPPH